MGVLIEGGGNNPGVRMTCLRLQDFRNYASAELHPTAGVNLFVGRNGQGKTNLVEAIHLATTGRLIRGRREAQAVRHGASVAGIVAEFEPRGHEVQIRLPVSGRKTLTVNGSPLRRASDLLGRAPCVCFTAESLEIVAGDPEERRHFLDTEASQLHPSFVKVCADYKRALQQRNSLLRAWRESHVSEAQFEPWEEQLAHGAEAIRARRREWVAELNPRFRVAYAEIGGTEEVSVKESPHDCATTAAEVFQRLRESRIADRDRGGTATGPHRDDLAVLIAGQDARDFASQGQKRAFVVALKMAVLELLAERLGSRPILLLDDVFSDLDSFRRASLFELVLNRGGQVFVTCTEPELAGERFLGGSTVFEVTSGSVAAR